MKMLRGWFGEKKTTFNMWMTLNANTYHRFHNVIIPSKNGTTQIDHLLISSYGVFIVETKNINGWIFGTEEQSVWTQTLFRKKYSFQNPLRQTFRQKKVLSGFLNLKESIIHEVIYFVGNCTFKTKVPRNVIKSGLSSYVKQFSERILSSEEVEQIIIKLNRHILESTLTTKDHIHSLHARHGSTTVCPRCGGNLVERIARKGPHSGSKFLGCENYPKCRFTKNA